MLIKVTIGLGGKLAPQEEQVCAGTAEKAVGGRDDADRTGQGCGGTSGRDPDSIGWDQSRANLTTLASLRNRAD